MDPKLDRTEMYAEIRKRGGGQDVLDVLDLLDDDALVAAMFFFSDIVDRGLNKAFSRLDTQRRAFEKLSDPQCDVVSRFAISLDYTAAERAAHLRAESSEAT